MNYQASPNDICANCGCPRWRHNLYVNAKHGNRSAHCKKCGCAKCKQFRWRKRA